MKLKNVRDYFEDRCVKAIGRCLVVHTNPVQSTEEVYKPMATTEVTICDGAKSILFLFCDEVDNVFILDATQLLGADLPFLVLIAGRQ